MKKAANSWALRRMRSISRLTTFGDSDDEEEEEEDPTKPFVNLNALEIAAVADAKRFLAQHVVQKIITSIWNGNIVFWDRKHDCPFPLSKAALMSANHPCTL